MVIKSKIFIKCNIKKFDSWNFHKDWISNCNVFCVFLVIDYHIWSFTNVEGKYVGLEPLINSYQFPIHCDMNIVNVTVGCKNCCVVIKMNKMRLIWGYIQSMSLIFKRKSTGPYTEASGTPNAMFDIKGTTVFDWVILYPIAQIRFKPALHDTSDAIMQELTYQYIMINCVECFWEIKYTEMVLCFLSNDQ